MNEGKSIETERINKGILTMDFTPIYKFNRKLGHKALKMYGEGFGSLEEKISTEAMFLIQRLKGTLEKPVDVRFMMGKSISFVKGLIQLKSHKPYKDCAF